MANYLLRDINAVFIHIPKTAGWSIREGLFRGNYDRRVVHGPMPEAWKNLISFAVIRDPRDRILSAYRMFTEGSELYKDKLIRPGISLRDFMSVVTDSSISYNEERKSWEERVRHHCMPQTHPFYGLVYAKYLLRFERLRYDLPVFLEEVLGNVEWAVRAARNLPHINVTRKGLISSFSDSYREDPTLWDEIILPFYGRDMDWLGYGRNFSGKYGRAGQ